MGTPVPYGGFDGFVNGSSADGEVSLHFVQPPSGWLYVLVHGAAVDGDSAEYDVHLSMLSGAEQAVAGGGREARYAQLAERWRYWVDPERAADGGYGEFVLGRHLDPRSDVLTQL